ncbi:MAG: pyridoxamine 5'-phosphate oxidase [Frankiales bacterium]|nr:pyridoxamine 5'-phosphate oxidase [Frankiales bacterium]
MAGLGWDEVAARFAAAANWWVATSGPAGPHAVPVWGVVVDDVLHFYGDPNAVRSQNLAADPRVALHLESGSDVLLVHGEAVALGPAGGVDAVNAAYAAKYAAPDDAQYLPDAPLNDASLLYGVRPERALAWSLGGEDSMRMRRWAPGG